MGLFSFSPNQQSRSVADVLSTGTLLELLTRARSLEVGHPARSRKFLEGLFWTLALQGLDTISSHGVLSARDGEHGSERKNTF